MVASLASGFSPESPIPVGMILSDGLRPDPSVLTVLARTPFPVFVSAGQDAHTTAPRSPGCAVGPMQGGDEKWLPPWGGLAVSMNGKYLNGCRFRVWRPWRRCGS